MSKAVLITGAAKRIGRTLALRLAQEGWDIALHYQSSLEEVKQTQQACQAQRSSGRYAIFQADLSQESDLHHLWQGVSSDFPYINALINNASLFEYDQAHNASRDLLQKHWQVNLMAPVYLSQQLYTHVKENKIQAGVLIHLLDQKLANLNPDFFSYTLSKAALQTSTHLMAQEWAPFVRVVGVAPGLSLKSHMISESEFQQLHQQAPMGKSSTPEDIADAVVFALGQKALTGTTLLIDGGQHLLGFPRDFSVMSS